MRVLLLPFAPGPFVRIDYLSLYRWIVRPALAMVLAGYFLLAVAVLAVRYLVLPSIDDYRPWIERRVSQAVGAQVRIGDLEADWRGLHPRLHLLDVAVSDARGAPVLVLPRVAAVLAWRTLLSPSPRTLSLQLDAPGIALRRDAQGMIWVAGLSFDPRVEGSGAGWRWLLAQRNIVVRGAQLTWLDEQRQAPPLTVDGFAFSMQNVGRRHRLALRAVPPAALAAPLDLRADFSHRLFARDKSDVQGWYGEAYARVGFADAAAWRPWLDLPAPLAGARGGAQAWLSFDRSRLTALTADVAFDHVALAGGDDRLAPLQGVSGRVEAALSDTVHRLAVHGAALTLADGRVLAPARLDASWQAADRSAPARGDVRAEGIDLALAAVLARQWPLPDEAARRLDEMAPVGRVERLALGWTGDWDAPADLSLSARFRGVGVAAAAAPPPGVASARRPGAANLDGEIEMTREGGRLAIDARDAMLAFPGVFEQPEIRARRLAAQARWQVSDGVVTVDLDQAEIEREGMRATFGGRWRNVGRSTAGTLELEGRMARAAVTDVHRFLPLDIEHDVRDWVRTGLLGGYMEDASFRVKGDLDDFPFRAGQGEFRIAGALRGVTLDYAPPTGGHKGWPRLENVSGRIVFDRAGLSVDAASGRVRVGPDATVAMGPTRARIADMVEGALLEIDGETQGDGGAYLRFVRQSPVGALIGGALDRAVVQGALRVPLSLRIPLTHVDDTVARGQVHLAGNALRMEPDAPLLSGLAGVVGFGNDGLFIDGATGFQLGGPVRLDAGNDEHGKTFLRAAGTATADGLRHWLPSPGLARLRGQAAYTVDVRMPAGQPVQTEVRSDLEGMAIDLPYPLGKAATQPMPLRVSWADTQDAAGRADGDWIAAGLGGVNLHLQRVRDAGGRVRDVRGAVGVNRPATLAGPGLGVSVQLDGRLDLDQWKAIGAEFAPAASPSAHGVPAGAAAVVGAGPAGRAEGAGGAQAWMPALDRINLRAGGLDVAGRRLDDVTLYAAREAQEGDWKVDVEAAQLAGRLQWSAREGGPPRLVARLKRLKIGDGEARQADETPGEEAAGNDEMPEIDLEAEQFELAGRPLGALSVLARRADRGRELRLERLSVANPDAVLEGRGVWRARPGAAPTEAYAMTLDATLTLHDAGGFLTRMGLPGAMAGGRGTLSGQLSWRGMPYALDLPSLGGQIAIELDKGQFLKAEPGIAKLLGVLSLQTLPRRVTLDFRDVFSEGFAYDTIRAHVGIAHGVAHTEDFKMNGVAATVVIAGDADLARETQKLRAVIVPKVDAGGASLLYGLAVNPAVGLSVFLAQWLLSNPLSSALTFQYDIHGTWADPVIERVGAARPTP